MASVVFGRRDVFLRALTHLIKLISWRFTQEIKWLECPKGGWRCVCVFIRDRERFAAFSCVAWWCTECVGRGNVPARWRSIHSLVHTLSSQRPCQTHWHHAPCLCLGTCRPARFTMLLAYLAALGQHVRDWHQKCDAAGLQTSTMEIYIYINYTLEFEPVLLYTWGRIKK